MTLPAAGCRPPAARRRARRWGSSPSTLTLPLSGLRRPPTHSTAVVLPAPLGPITPKISALLTENDTSSTATVEPYALWRCWTSTTQSDRSHSSPMADGSSAISTTSGPRAGRRSLRMRCTSGHPLLRTRLARPGQLQQGTKALASVRVCAPPARGSWLASGVPNPRLRVGLAVWPRPRIPPWRLATRWSLSHHHDVGAEWPESTPGPWAPEPSGNRRDRRC